MEGTEKSLYGFEVRIPDKRRVEEGTRQVNIQQLWQHSHEIILLKLQGYKNTQIAELLGISPQTVSNTINSDLGKEKLSRLREERDGEATQFHQRVNELTERALEVYSEIFENPSVDYKMKKETADTIVMDIAGHRAPTKVQSQNMNVTANMDQINAFKERGLKAARESGLLVTIEDKEVVNE